jgi:hypothetical protein
MYKCECDVTTLASYGLVVVGGFDLGECHRVLFFDSSLILFTAIASQILEFPFNNLAYLFKFYRNYQSYSTLVKRSVASPASLDDVYKVSWEYVMLLALSC